jgi:hypothetical protein
MSGPDARRRYWAMIERRRLLIALVLTALLQPIVLMTTRAPVPNLIFAVIVFVSVLLGIRLALSWSRNRMP